MKLTAKDLMSFGISENTIKSSLRRNRLKNGKGTWKHYPSPDDRKVKIIFYDSLPTDTKAKLPAKKDLIELALRDQKEDSEADNSVSTELLPSFIEDYFLSLSDYQYFFKNPIQNHVENKATDLMKAASYLRFLNAYKSKKQTQNISRDISFENKEALRLAVLKIIKDESEEKGRFLYGFKVQSAQVLQRKELAFGKAYYEAFENHSNEVKTIREKLANEAALNSLIHGGFSNQNKRLIGKTTGKGIVIGDRIDLSEWHANTLGTIYRNNGEANIFDLENVYFRYLRRCADKAITPVSKSTAKRFLTSPEVAPYLTRERHGYSELDKVLPEVLGQRPSQSLNKGGFDGLLVKLPYEVTEYKNGKKEVREDQLVMVPVFDYHSQAITGFDIGPVESGTMIRKAYKHHLDLTGNKNFLEIESDRFAGAIGEETVQFFKKAGVKVNQSAPDDITGGAKAKSKNKYFERLIMEFKRLMQNYPEFKGLSVKRANSLKSHPNPDKKRKRLDSYEKAVQTIIQLVNIYNGEKKEELNGLARIEAFHKNMNEKAEVLADEVKAFLMYRSTIAKVFKSNIQFEVNGVEHNFLYTQWTKESSKLVSKGQYLTAKVYYDEKEIHSPDAEILLYSYTSKDDQSGDVFIRSLKKRKAAYRDEASQGKADLARIHSTNNARKMMQEDFHRKELEAQINYYFEEFMGEPFEEANLPLKDLKQILSGLESKFKDQVIEPAEVLYADRLNTEYAQKTTEYYNEELLRDRGYQVPATINEEAEVQRLKREINARKFKRNNPPSDGGPV